MNGYNDMNNGVFSTDNNTDNTADEIWTEGIKAKGNDLVDYGYVLQQDTLLTMLDKVRIYDSVPEFSANDMFRELFYEDYNTARAEQLEADNEAFFMEKDINADPTFLDPTLQHNYRLYEVLPITPTNERGETLGDLLIIRSCKNRASARKGEHKRRFAYWFSFVAYCNELLLDVSYPLLQLKLPEGVDRMELEYHFRNTIARWLRQMKREDWQLSTHPRLKQWHSEEVDTEEDDLLRYCVEDLESLQRQLIKECMLAYYEAKGCPIRPSDGTPPYDGERFSHAAGCDPGRISHAVSTEELRGEAKRRCRITENVLRGSLMQRGHEVYAEEEWQKLLAYVRAYSADPVVMGEDFGLKAYPSSNKKVDGGVPYKAGDGTLMNFHLMLHALRLFNDWLTADRNRRRAQGQTGIKQLPPGRELHERIKKVSNEYANSNNIKNAQQLNLATMKDYYKASIKGGKAGHITARLTQLLGTVCGGN